MGKFVNLVGKRFGRWTVIKHAGRYKFGGALWLCLCDCGAKSTIRSRALNKAHTRSCGCLVKDDGFIERRGDGYGYRGTQIYNTYYNIRKRCDNSGSKFYYCYGGRGIKCEWTTFSEFLKDMGDAFDQASVRYKGRRISIERKDTNGNYNKENCCWIPLVDQPRNTRANVYLTLQGHKMIVSDWAKSSLCKRMRINKNTIRDRKKLGWSDEEALTTPVRKLERKNNHERG